MALTQTYMEFSRETHKAYTFFSNSIMENVYKRTPDKNPKHNFDIKQQSRIILHKGCDTDRKAL